MDRKTWIAIILCIAGLILWQWWYTKTYPPRPPAPPVPADVAAGTSSPADAPAQASATPVAPATPPPTMISPRTESLLGRSAEYQFSNDTGGIQKVVLLLHLGENQSSVFLNREGLMPIGALGIVPGEVIGGFEMRTDLNKGDVEFVGSHEGFGIVKRFSVPEKEDSEENYTVEMEVVFSNPSENKRYWPDFFVSAGAAAPVHNNDLPHYTRFDWYRSGKMSKIDVNWFSVGKIPLLGIQTRPARSIYLEQDPNVSWAAVSSQYFCTVVTVDDANGNAVWAKRFETARHNGNPVFGIQGALGLPGFELDPGETRSVKFTIYSGPKQLSILDSLGGGQRDIMNFGMFGLVSEFLLWSMNSIYGLVGNYAAAIIVLTILIKSALWPLQNKATNSMRQMAALSPKMTELRAKYKDDPQKMNEELMKLYREYGVNPFSGCLPMLVQIPIFFGFYTMLGTAIELRNSSFLWVTDLSQPDTVAHVFGFPINLLPLVMAGTMIWQMVITPKTGDKTQQRIFYIMPVIFLVFCYNFASALALYWTTQNLFSIVQLYLTRNKPLPQLEKKSAVAKRAALDTKKKKRKRPTP